jgi:hypothetical protein
MDHDFLAAFLAGEIQSRHLDSLKAAGDALQFPDEDVDALELERKDPQTVDTDPGCTGCKECPLVTEHPICDTKLQCQTRPPHCKTHEHECKTHEHCKHKPEHEPPKHASWFDRL